MSKNTYTFLMEELQPHRVNDRKSEVHFYWNAASQTWSVTWKGLPVSGVTAAELIAAAKTQGMIDPESDKDQEQEQDEDIDFDLDR
jgi:hypothetical protein